MQKNQTPKVDFFDLAGPVICLPDPKIYTHVK